MALTSVALHERFAQHRNENIQYYSVHRIERRCPALMLPEAPPSGMSGE